jgi:hypothetical protein
MTMKETRQKMERGEGRGRGEREENAPQRFVNLIRHKKPKNFFRLPSSPKERKRKQQGRKRDVDERKFQKIS